MSIFKNKENFLKALCIAHPLVLHNATIDGVVRKSFFRVNNEEELGAAVANDIAYPCVGNIHIDGRVTDYDNAMVDIRHVMKNAWIFLDHVDTPVDADGIGSADKIQDAFDLTFSIMEDFIKAMKDDYELNEKCGVFFNFNLNRINYVQVGPVHQNEYGWILYFEDEYPATRIIDGTTIDWDGGVDIENPREPEIIFIVDESSKVVDWTTSRRKRFGNFPVVDVYLTDDKGVLYKADFVQPVPDEEPPDFSVLTFSFSGNQNGFIVIK